VLIAPASADFIKQLHYQDSKLATAITKSEKPVMVAPAMNIMMWQHPATQRNSKALIASKVYFLGPVEGNMACGDKGYGRFMEPADIADAVAARLDEKKHKAFEAVKFALDASPKLPAIDASLAKKTHKKILLMIQGGQDALATYSLISSLRSHGYDVTCAASKEVAALLPQQGLATMSNTPAYTHHYQDDVQGMEHIRLPERSDIVLIAPATAEGVKDMTEGGAQSFLGCLYLATKKPVVLVPSCDKAHQPAIADLTRLKHDGVSILSVPQQLPPQQLPFASKARADAIASELDMLLKQKPIKNKSHVG
jgi:phosphopantothenoylcysteine synthetase/decarboxylase